VGKTQYPEKNAITRPLSWVHHVRLAATSLEGQSAYFALAEDTKAQNWQELDELL
jgi:hypothetical protein